MDSWIWWVSIWQFVRQIGMGFVLMPITTWSLNCLSPKEVSAGSAVTNTVRQIAGRDRRTGIGDSDGDLRRDASDRSGRRLPTWRSPRACSACSGALRVSAVICFGMVLMVFFGVKGNGAGSTHDLVQRALRRMHEVIEH